MLRWALSSSSSANANSIVSEKHKYKYLFHIYASQDHPQDLPLPFQLCQCHEEEGRGRFAKPLPRPVLGAARCCRSTSPAGAVSGGSVFKLYLAIAQDFSKRQRGPRHLSLLYRQCIDVSWNFKNFCFLTIMFSEMDV